MKENEVYFCPVCQRVIIPANLEQNDVRCPCCGKYSKQSELKKTGGIFLDSFTIYIGNFYIIVGWNYHGFSINVWCPGSDPDKEPDYVGYYDEDGNCQAGDELGMTEFYPEIEKVIFKVFSEERKFIKINMEDNLMKKTDVYFCPKCGRIVSREKRSTKQYAAACTYCDEDFFAIELKKKGIVCINSFRFYVLKYYITADWINDIYRIQVWDVNENFDNYVRQENPDYTGYYDDEGDSIAGDELNMPEDCKQVEETILKVFYNMIKGVPVSLETK